MKKRGKLLSHFIFHLVHMAMSFVIPLTPEALMKSSDSETRYSLVQFTDVSHLSDKEVHKNLDSM